MILSIAGSTGTGIPSGLDLSTRVDRLGSFDIEAAIGKRIDTSHFFLMDTLPSSMQVPDRAEIVIYDVPSNLLSYAATILADHPVDYKRLNDTGTMARDWTGFGNTGTLAGGVTTGATGALNDGDKAMIFNGSTGLITTASTPVAAPMDFSGNKPYSVEAWVKLTTAPGAGNWPRIVERETYVTRNGWSLLINQSSTQVYSERWAAGVGTSSAFTALTLNTWTHVVAVYDGVKLHLYVNGVENGTGVASAGAVTAQAGQQALGGVVGGGSNFTGSIDEEAVYDYALSLGQIQAHYQMGLACIADPQVTDPPWAVTAYNTFIKGAGSELTSATPANWTPRLFGGYVATPKYTIDGAQRYIEISCQDYTVRLRTTVTNMAFAAGNTDQTIINQLFARYRPDYNTANVSVVTASFPAITYPVHTLEQCLERIIKVSRGYYRADYYKQMWYGVVGQQTAPFNLSDVPNNTTTFPTEDIDYTPDGSGLANRVWVIGSTYLSTQQDYQVPPALVNGSTYQFPLPGNPESTGMSITVGGVNQGTIGVAPGDGDTATPSSFKYNTLISHVPATVSFKTPPGSGVAVHIIGKFRYPLVQVVTDPALIAATNGVIFEAVVRDKRINDSALAKAVGQAFLKNQGSTLKGGSCTIRTRQVGGVLLQPGHVITIKNDALFRNILKDAAGNLTTTAVVVVTQLRTQLDDDISQPYAVQLSFADRNVSGGY